MTIRELGFKNDKAKDGLNREVHAASDSRTCPVRAMAALLERQAAKGASDGDPVFTSIQNGKVLSLPRGVPPSWERLLT
jgi:hypothetical protein